MPPIFSFEKMADKSGYSVNCCGDEDLIALAKRMFHLSRTPWRDIVHGRRHGTGTEKIDRNSINPAIPAGVTKDTTFLALRFNGKKPIVGFREGRVFHVLFIDKDFSVYAH